VPGVLGAGCGDAVTGHTPTQPASRGLPWGALVGIVVLGLVGFAMLAYAILALTGGASPAATPPPDRSASTPAPTQIAVVIPTITSAPALSPTAQPLDQPTAGAPLPDRPTSTAAPAGPVLNILQPANVRSGPGFDYPVIGGLQAGEAASAVGRDASAQWYVIEYAASVGGRGWVSILVSSYSGDANGLPVVAAPPPPPPPTNTPAPTAPPATATLAAAHGITGQLTLCDPARTIYGNGERICFKELIKNNTASTIRYGVLGVQATSLAGGPGVFQTSWSGDLAIDPGCFGPMDRCGGQWEDGVKITNSGPYRLTLQICYSSKSACLDGGEWETLTPGIDITVQ
jgi:hypothetical protein